MSGRRRRSVAGHLTQWAQAPLPREYQNWIWHALEELRPSRRPPGVTTSEALRAVRHGFLPQRCRQLPLHDARARRRYLTDLEHRRIKLRAPGWLPPSEDKLLFSLLYGHLRHGPPRAYGMLIDGEYYALSDEGRDEPGLLAEVRRRGAIVIKPTRLSGFGHGVMELEHSSGTITCNGQPLTADAVESLARQQTHSAVTETLTTGQYASHVLPGTQHSIRIIACRHPDRTPHLVAAAHRFATRATFPSDAPDQGALTARIDLATGVLGTARRLTSDRTVTTHDAHPDSGAAITGLQVPQWQRACDAVRDLMERTPQLALAGWDLIITDDGPRAIEGEKEGAVSLEHDLHQPILADPVLQDALQRAGYRTRRHRLTPAT